MLDYAARRDSREHSIKRTYLVRRRIGEGPTRKQSSKSRGRRVTAICQAETSKLLKRSHGLFPTATVLDHNPGISYPFHGGLSHEHVVRKSRKYRFQPDDSIRPGQLANTYRYIAKAFGCALADTSAEMPTELSYLACRSIPLYVYFAAFKDLQIGDRLKPESTGWRVKAIAMAGHTHWTGLPSLFHTVTRRAKPWSIARATIGTLLDA